MKSKYYQNIPKWLRGEFKKYRAHSRTDDCQFLRDLMRVMVRKRVSPSDNVIFYLALTSIDQNIRIIECGEMIGNLQDQVLALKTEIRELKRKRKP